METLRRIRPDDSITLIDTDADPAFVMLKMKKREENQILIFTSVSDKVAEQVLSQIDAYDSGYVFFPRDVDVDPLNNNMVPSHRLASDEEIRKHISDRHIPLSKLPILPMSDPIRRWYNFKKSSIVVIERPQGLYFRRTL